MTEPALSEDQRACVLVEFFRWDRATSTIQRWCSSMRMTCRGSRPPSDSWPSRPEMKLREKLPIGSVCQEALVICEARGDEERYGQWYLQDGSHRALASATLMLLCEARYEQQKAYCSMSKGRYQALSQP